MRQGQQHRRGRGRNNNNNNNNNNNSSRKGHNPLSRSFESNGPDVKVRGTPAHIAEKYLSLARDAQSSGDPVLAENYFQHAEHYSRIIMTYREQQMQHSGEAINGNSPRIRPSGMSEGSEPDEGFDDDGDDLGQREQPSVPRFQQEQPRLQEHARSDESRPQRGNDHGRFRDRHDRNERPDRQNERQPNSDRQPEARSARDRGSDSQPPSDAGGFPRGDQQQRRRERFGPGNEQPEFLRRPVRRPRREDGNGEADGNVESGSENDPQDKTTV